MNEATNPCKALNCDCKGFTEAPSKDGIWKVCGVVGCGHTVQSHGVVVSNGFKSTVVELPKSEAPKPVSTPSVASSAPFASIGDITPKMMRAWLVANKVPDVGVRGRLRPEHIAIASKALMGL